MLHEGAGPGALGVVRIVVFGVWAGIVATTPLHLLAPLASIHAPPGVLALLPVGFWEVFLTPSSLSLFRWGLVLLLLTVAGGVGPHRTLALMAALGLILFDGTTKGFGGYINHGRFAILYAAILLALFPGGGGFRWSRSKASPWPSSGERNAPEPGAVLRVGALLSAVSYALVGLFRLVEGGMAIFLDDSLPTYLVLRTFEPGGYKGNLGYLFAASPLLILGVKAGFVAATAAEILTPLAVFRRRLRWGWLGVMVPFHLMTLLTMNIFFWENLVLIAVLFTGVPEAVERRWGGNRWKGGRGAGGEPGWSGVARS